MGLFKKNKNENAKGYSTTSSDVGKSAGFGTSDSGKMDFDTMIDRFEALGKETATMKCMATVRELMDKLDGPQFASFTIFMMWSVSADGVLTKEEFDLTAPIFSIVLKKEDVDYAYASGFVGGLTVSQAADLQRKATDIARDLLSSVDRETAAKILITGILLSACDGKVSPEERRFLKSIISN